jgi:iron complex outermembrane receptor protein
MGGCYKYHYQRAKNRRRFSHANQMYGSYQTFKAAINGGFMHKGFSVNAGINHDESDGHRPSSDFNINDGYFKTGYQFNKHFKLTGDMSLARFKAQDPGKYYSDTLIPGEHIDIKRGWARCFQSPVCKNKRLVPYLLQLWRTYHEQWFSFNRF